MTTSFVGFALRGDYEKFIVFCDFHADRKWIGGNLRNGSHRLDIYYNDLARLIYAPKKNRKGNRQFTKEDIDQIRLIYHLVKEKGFTLSGAKEMLKQDAIAIKGKMEMIDSLKNIRKFLTEIKEKLQ